MRYQRLSRDQLESVLDALPEAVVTIDREFQVTGLNRAAETTFGCTAVDALGRPCRDLLHEAVCDYVSDCPLAHQYAHAANNGAAYELLVQGPDLPPIRVTARLLRDGNGKVVGGIETFVREALPDNGPNAHGDADLTPLDVSERRTIEDVLRRHNWNRASTCDELGLSRTTLWRKMARLGIDSRPGRRSRG